MTEVLLCDTKREVRALRLELGAIRAGSLREIKRTLREPHAVIEEPNAFELWPILVNAW